MSTDLETLYKEAQNVKERLTILETRSEERHKHHADNLICINADIKTIHKDISSLKILINEKLNSHGKEISTLLAHKNIQWFIIGTIILGQITLKFLFNN